MSDLNVNQKFISFLCTFQLLTSVCMREDKPIRWTAPDLYQNAVLNHVCYNLTPAMGKFLCKLVDFGDPGISNIFYIVSKH